MANDRLIHYSAINPTLFKTTSDYPTTSDHLKEIFRRLSLLEPGGDNVEIKSGNALLENHEAIDRAGQQRTR